MGLNGWWGFIYPTLLALNWDVIAVVVVVIALHICIDFFTLFLPVCISDWCVWCQLESNLRPLALTPDWLKHVDSLAKMGSGHHIIINSSRVRHGIGKKKSRHLEPEGNPSSNAGSGLSLFWWRGGRLSRRLFNWKLLPQSLARKAARQGMDFHFLFKCSFGFWSIEQLSFIYLDVFAW